MSDQSKRYVGVTGFTSRAQVDACLAALPDGLTLMCGVLASEKTLRGERNKPWRRYPPPHEIADIFSDDPRCLNLIHYASDTPPTPLIVGVLRHRGGPRCHGFQFNVSWPEPLTVAALRDLSVVLQFRPGKSDPKDVVKYEALGLNGLRFLLDGSGGRGEALAPETWRTMVKHWRLSQPWCNLGIAGGLCAETVPGVARLAWEYELSIDAEGKLRDGDEGGTLNLDKVRDYLAAAGELLNERRS